MSHARKKLRYWIALTERGRLGAPIRCVPKPYYGTATCFGLHRAARFATKREAVAALRRLDLPPRYRATVLPLDGWDDGAPRPRGRAAATPGPPSGLPVVPGTPITPEGLARANPAEAARRSLHARRLEAAARRGEARRAAQKRRACAP